MSKWAEPRKRLGPRICAPSTVRDWEVKVLGASRLSRTARFIALHEFTIDGPLTFPEHLDVHTH